MRLAGTGLVTLCAVTPADAEDTSLLRLRWEERSPLPGASRLFVARLGRNEAPALVLAREQGALPGSSPFPAREGGFVILDRQGGRLVSRLAHAGWLLEVADSDADGVDELYFTQANALKRGRWAGQALEKEDLAWAGYGFAPPPRGLHFLAMRETDAGPRALFRQDLVSRLLWLDPEGLFHAARLTAEGRAAASFEAPPRLVRLGTGEPPRFAMLERPAAASLGRIRILELGPGGLRSQHASKPLYGGALAAGNLVGDARQEVVAERDGALCALHAEGDVGLAPAGVLVEPDPRRPGHHVALATRVPAEGGPHELVSLWRDESGRDWLRGHAPRAADGS